MGVSINGGTPGRHHPLILGMFPELNHPSIGVPPLTENTLFIWYPHQNRQIGNIFIEIVSRCFYRQGTTIFRKLSMGVPLVIIHFKLGFFHHKPSINRGTPMTSWKPPLIDTSSPSVQFPKRILQVSWFVPMNYITSISHENHYESL